jgi:hypothetical protein
VIVTSASPFMITPVDARERPHGYGPRHVGIFASEVVAIFVLILRQAHSQCPSRSRQPLRERSVSLLGEGVPTMQRRDAYLV